MSSDAVTTVSVEIAGSEISFETGKMARQASGAVVVRQGDTMVLSTATIGNLRDVDFLPLTVDVEERMYAAGKIPGSFFKREGRAGEKGTLTARMIDRPIRPLFPKGWHFETQLVNMPLSVDHVHPYDVLAMNGASAALMLSPVPLAAPVGAVRIGKVDGNFVVNPSEADLVDNTDLDLVVAGTDEAILMVEAGANEVSEAEMLDALDIAHSEIKKLCALQRELAEKAGKEKLAIEAPQVDEDLIRQIAESHGLSLDEATSVEDKLARQAATKAVEEAVLEQYCGDPEADTYAEFRQRAQLAFDRIEKTIIRERIAKQKRRPDGRAEREIRPITIEVGVAPRTHGSALFTRGQTQALSVAALGTLKEEMRLDTLGLETQKFYWHHYNFPPFSVGEAGFMRGPKRRDIGHGALAERALVPVVPEHRGVPVHDPCRVRHPRVQRLVLDGLGLRLLAGADGRRRADQERRWPASRWASSRRATTTSSSPTSRAWRTTSATWTSRSPAPRTGSPPSRWTSRSPASPSRSCATRSPRPRRPACRSSARCTRRSPRRARSSRPTRRASSPCRSTRTRSACSSARAARPSARLQDEYEAQIDVNDDGQVLVYSRSGELGDALAERIRTMTKEVEVGDEYTGKVVKTTTFGAFVELAKGTDGLLHISNIAPGQRPATVEEVLNKGDEVSVRVVEVDRERGRIGLRLADDPDIAGKTKEELVVGRHGRQRRRPAARPRPWRPAR